MLCLVIRQMLEGVYQNAAAMSGLEAWNNSVAQNLAQSSSPGYKKAVTAFEGAQKGSYGVSDDFGHVLQRAAIQTKGSDSVDFTAGPSRVTDGQYDFSLEGDGFFELRAPDGRMIYTRDGEFRVNPDGELVSKQGYHVMSDTRDTIELIPEGGVLQGAPDGTLRQNNQIIGQVGVRQIENPAELVRAHGGFALPAESRDPARHVEDARMRHGSLEQSNVSATHEMINLITLSRSYEINQRVIQQHDDRLGKAIQQLGGR